MPEPTIQQEPEEGLPKSGYVQVGIFTLPTAMLMELMYEEDTSKALPRPRELVERFANIADKEHLKGMITMLWEWSQLRYEFEEIEGKTVAYLKVEPEIRKMFAKFAPQWKKHRLCWLKIEEC